MRYTRGIDTEGGILMRGQVGVPGGPGKASFDGRARRESRRSTQQVQWATRRYRLSAARQDCKCFSCCATPTRCASEGLRKRPSLTLRVGVLRNFAGRFASQFSRRQQPDGRRPSSAFILFANGPGMHDDDTLRHPSMAAPKKNSETPRNRNSRKAKPP
jgi:hypothetical protein